MKRWILASLIFLLTAAALPAAAQLGSLKKIIKDKAKVEKPRVDKNAGEVKNVPVKTGPAKNLPADPEYFYVGVNELDGTGIGGLKVCSDNYKGRVNWKNEFKQWIDEISPTAQLKMFEMKRCELMGFRIVNKPGRKYRRVEDLAERMQGYSVYQVEKGELALVSEFATPDLYVVVVPAVARPDLQLKDLNLCVKPEQKDHYRRKVRGVSGCHDLKQMLYVFENYKKYPGEYQTNSALFFDKDFKKLDGQGKFRGLKIYRLSDGQLAPM